ncbi:MAG: dihydroxyacetone kinase subunit DhaL [Actinobacteria bacterium]|nr:dihydroxyacetone kinase subunit DhaL [Cyanobacteriota bacterium]MCL5772267.1 dihydroxyacetone kinase subunit DhaL [Actinomycetota bacterium]
MKTQKEILIEIIENICKNLIDAEQMLTELDSHIGDGDCGIGVRKGFEAVQKIIPELSKMEISDILKKTGFTLAYTIGGTSGAMLGTGFIELGKGLKEKLEPNIFDWVSAMNFSLEAIKRRGGNTKVGDKTMIDALEPAVLSMINSIDTNKEINIVTLFEKALSAAKAGSESTINLTAKKGRASYLGERSIGFKDPGSVIVCIILESAYNCLKNN